MKAPLFIVDAFTDKPFGGNPAAICMLDGPAHEAWMQSVAAEMNLSETAYLFEKDGVWRLRWFTPAVEVDLCGHATLASAHTLWETGRLSAEQDAEFETASGRLTCRQAGDGWIEMDFPALPVSAAQAPPELLTALGAEPVWSGRTAFDWFLELESEQAVRSLAPNHPALGELPVRGVICTAGGSGKPYDFVSRFFAPGSGIDEDPVTGSAHCALAPHWAARLGKLDMLAFQASARGGIIRVRPAGDRVRLAGRAVTVVRGEINA